MAKIAIMKNMLTLLVLTLMIDIMLVQCQDRIVNGLRSSNGKWPFMAALLIDGKQTCGGAIINADSIITAAHCL